MVFHWISGQGTETISDVLSTFKADNQKYVVVRVGRGRYDVAPPFAVMNVKDGRLDK